MSRSGIRRKVDDLGRVVIPVGLRRTLAISEGDELEFSLEGDRIVLARPQDACVVCGASDALLEVHARHVCAPCARDVAQHLDQSDQVLVLPEAEPSSRTAW